MKHQCQTCAHTFTPRGQPDRVRLQTCPRCKSTDIDILAFVPVEEMDQGTAGFFPFTPPEIVQRTLAREQTAKDRAKRQGEWW